MRQPLSRKCIVATALRIIDKEGLDALTMRRIAAQLRVKAPSLYDHISSKEDLLDAISDALLGQLELTANKQMGWRAQTLALVQGFRRLAAAHPKAVPLLAARPAMTPESLRPVEVLVTELRGAGFQDEDAVYAVECISAFVIGFLLSELGTSVLRNAGDHACGYALDYERFPPREFPSLVELAPVLDEFDVDTWFEFSLDVILDGLEARLLPRQ